ncbi:MAG: redoxin domain-containing protein [Treponema sp.]|nr:redoxin domain-containing protein [Treponema sp.]
MTTKSKNLLVYVLIALVFFVAGMIFVPSGTLVRKVQKSLSYTKSISQKLYDGWEKDKLYFSDGTSLKDFENSNENYIIYFWATWCPHCRNITGEVNSLKNAGIPLIGLTFDASKDEYNSYRTENPCFWEDLFQKDENGEFVFCPRKDSYNIPSIPSVWVVEKGKVKELYRGEERIKKFCKRW